VAGLRSADRVVAPTRAVIEDLRRNYRLPLDRAAVIANGIDVAGYGPRPKQPVIMAAGRLWDAAKNLALLDDVAEEVPWPVEIAGDAVHPETGTACVARVRLLGRLRPPELAARLAVAAIYAAPARYEPFGLGILEAAASGCALVLGDIPSLRETWQGAALFVDPGDPGGLTDALQHLIGNRWERERLAEAALQRAGNYSQTRMAAQYAALYQALIPAAAVGATRLREVA
jgi:glycosyltransferase involved in cell wall biosynthesis